MASVNHIKRKKGAREKKKLMKGCWGYFVASKEELTTKI